MKYIVYLTINNVNRKVYVGVHGTDDPNKFDGYIGCGVTTTTKTFKEYPFHRAVRKYGYESFERLTLGVFDTAEEAYKQERCIVTEEFIKRKDTYNVKPGGIGGNGHTSRILQYSADGKFMREWDSVKSAYTFFNKKTGNRLIKTLTGKDKTYLGFQWRYWEPEFPRSIPPVEVLVIPLYQYDLDGKLVKVWVNKLKAAKHLGCSASGIRHATQSLKSYCGFQWRYFDNDAPDRIPEYIDPAVVLQLDQNGVVIKEWLSLKDLKSAGLYVTKHMIPKTKAAKEYKWIYKKDYIRS